MPPPATKSSGVVVPHPPKWHGRLGARVVHALICLIAATIRFRWRDNSGLFNNGSAEPVIFCIWHNRLAFSLVLYRDYVRSRQPQRRMAALVSASKDGGFLSRILELFNVQPVRGSSSRRGPQALLELTSCAKDGFDLAITPDGPRGPCYSVQDGIISLAQLTGLPILPVSYSLSWKYRIKSWDRFQVPLPFARCEVTLGEPLRIPREASDAERAAFKEKLETVMKSITAD